MVQEGIEISSHMPAKSGKFFSTNQEVLQIKSLAEALLFCKGGLEVSA